MIMISLFGRTGSGKSTAAGLIAEHFAARGQRAARLKLAEPLYELQAAFYRAAGLSVDYYAQDQVLLETIADHLRRISPTGIVDHFLARLDALEGVDAVVNDDLRDVDTDYPALRRRGFRFVRVACPEPVRLGRLGRRADLTASPHSHSESALDRLPAHFTLDNGTNDIAALRTAVDDLCRRLAS